jgi:Mor family transcriptional regulator
MRDFVIQPDDLNEEQQHLAELIGLDNFAKLVQVFGGTNIYIPKAEAFGRTVRNEKIRQEYNGRNIKSLAVKYGLTERQVYKLIDTIPKGNYTRVLDG